MINRAVNELKMIETIGFETYSFYTNLHVNSLEFRMNYNHGYLFIGIINKIIQIVKNISYLCIISQKLLKEVTII